MSSATRPSGALALSRRLPLVTYVLELEPPFPAVFVSPQMAELFGYLPHEFDQPGFWLQQVVAADRQRLVAALEQLRRTGGTLSVDYRIVARDGREVWVRDVGIVEDGEYGSLHLHGFLTDVTREKELERELADERAQAEAFFRDSPAGMGITDAGGRYLRVNDALARINDVPAAEHLGRTLSEISPEHAAAALPLLDEVRRTGEAIFQQEVRIDRPGGERSYLVSYFPVEAASEEQYGRIVLDITDQRRAEQRYRSLIEQLPLVTYVNAVGPESQAIFVSPQIEELYGYPAEQWLDGPRLWDEVVHPDDLENVVAAEAAARESGEPFELEYRIVRSDGAVRWVLDLMETVRDAHGAPLLEQGFLVDVTERKETENLFRAVFDGAFEAVVIVDADGRYVDVNPAACELFGRTRDELVGLEAGRLSASQEEAVEAFRALVETGVATGTHEFVRPDGTVREAEFAARANVLPGVHISVLRDVTERRRLERELWRAHRLESVGRLAGGIAHDFNNLLTAIRGHARLTLSHTEPGAPEHQHAEEIDRAAGRAAELTAQLLAFGRRQMLDPRPVDPNRLVEQLAPMLERLTGDDVELDLRLGGGLPAVRVDRAQIEQLLVNLVVNAADVTPAGERIVVRSASGVAVDELPDGRYVVLSVEDAGPGIDPAMRDNLFEPFFTTKGVGAGTGLGLATAYGIAKQSGGTIIVSDAAGGGATFSVYLPEAAVAPSGDPADDGHGERVLVVESDPSVRDVVFELLTDAGYRVFTARTPADALALASELEEGVDLVLTELEGLRARTLGESLPGARLLRLHKPYTPDQLRGEVRRALDRG